MPTSDDLVRSGNRLFRWRSYWPLPLIGLALVAAYAWPREDITGWLWVCIGVSALGFAIRVATVGRVPAGTSGRSTLHPAAETLNVTGMYSMVRHPLYLGNYFMGLGVMTFPALWWLPLLFSLSFWWYYRRIMLAEDAFLRAEFGAAFDDWSRRTPAFVPAPGLFVAAELGFSIRSVVRRENPGVYAVVATLFALDLARSWGLSGSPRPSGAWGSVFVGATAVWLVTLLVKRGTSLLDVAGR